MQEYAVFARQIGDHYYKIVKYQGTRTFQESKLSEICLALKGKNFEFITVEHKSPFDLIDLDTIMLKDLVKKE